MNRYLREKNGWDYHLSKTREFINTSFAGTSIESVAVLGSGWLLDVPLEDMLARYQTIYLVDIYHPPQVRKKAGPLKQVKLIEADLTGGAIEQIWQTYLEKGLHSIDHLLNMITLSNPIPHLSPGAVISVNLINQLDIQLTEFIEKKSRISGEDLRPFRHLIQKFHLDWISRTPGCLVTDTVEINVDRHGEVSNKSLLYAELPDGLRSGGWIWEFDTHGTYLAETLTRMEVQAIEWG